MNILAVFPKIREMEVLDITNPWFNELPQFLGTSLDQGSTVQG